MATMPALGVPDPSARRGTWSAAISLAAIVVAVRLLDVTAIPWLQNLLLIFTSLLVEATPFVLVGAAVSALIEVAVPRSFFERIGRLPRPAQLPAAALMGVAFPVCECGSVPVARRLARKGLAPGASITFMLAAPILNPVVIASTFVAYRGQSSLAVMVVGRLGLGFLVAVAAGWVIGRGEGTSVLRHRPVDEATAADETRPGARFFEHLAGDVVFMGRFLVIGAAIAATIQTFVPQTFVNAVAGTPIVGLLAMMLLAFLMSLCSESDAFVAASFTAFGPAAQLAFLVFGPMMDVKLGALYLGTFRRDVVGAMVLAVVVVTVGATSWIQVVFG